MLLVARGISVLMAAGVAGVFAPLAGGLSPSPRGVDAAVAYDPPEEDGVSISAIETPVTLHGFDCKNQKCTGTRLLNPTATGLAGCNWNGSDDPQTAKCTGDCSYCTGDGLALVCVKTPNADCIIGGAGAAPCGTISTNPCYWSTTTGLQEHCWCNNTNGNPSLNPCNITNCQ